jgi:hypothetical protein
MKVKLSEYVNDIHNIEVHGFGPNEMQQWRSIRFKVGSSKMHVAHSYAYMSPACWCQNLVKVLWEYRWTNPSYKGEWLVTVRQNAVTVYRLKYHQPILLFVWWTLSYGRPLGLYHVYYQSQMWNTGSTHLVSGVTICAVCCNVKYHRVFIRF